MREETASTCNECGHELQDQAATCENCAKGLAEGSSSSPDPAVNRPPSLVSSVPQITFVFEVDTDPHYFAEVVTEQEIDYPDPAPELTRIELTGSEISIGRANEAGSVVPDLDIVALTDDPAVSSRHAVVRPGTDGKITIVDVGSTNGTFLEKVDSAAIAPGEPTELDLGTPIYLGAWTRLRIVSR